jgi:hypothetical protein
MSVSERVRIILGLETGEAKESLQGLQNELKQTDAVAAKTGGSMRDLSHDVKRLEEGTGKADQVVNGLAGALGLVSPEAAEAARSIGDMTGGLEAVLRTGPSMIAILGPVAVAVAAMGLAWKMAADDLKEAEERMDAAAKKAETWGAAFERMKDSADRRRLEAAAALGDLSAPGALREMDVRAQVGGERGEFRGLMEADVLAKAQAAVALRSQVPENLTGLRAAGRLTEEQEQLAQSAAAAEAALAAARVQLEEYTKGTERAVQEQLLLLDYQDEVAAAKAAAAPKAGGGGGRAAAAVSADPTGFSFKSGVSDQMTVDALLAKAQPGDVLIQTPDGPALLKGAGNAPTVTITEAPTAAVVGKPAVGSWAGDAVTAGVKGYLGATTALATGDAMGGLGALGAFGGPAGMALSSGLGFLGSVGDKGADGVRANLEGFTESIVAGLRALPEILKEVIPDFVGGLVENLVPALVETFPRLVALMAFELPVAIAAALWSAIRSLVPGDGVKADTGWGGKTANTLLDIVTFGESGRKGWGVGRGDDWLAEKQLVRQAEREGGSSRSSSSRSAGRGAINFHGPVIGSADAILRQIDRQTIMGYSGSTATAGWAY